MAMVSAFDSGLGDSGMGPQRLMERYPLPA
jgi:hypothetical protein